MHLVTLIPLLAALGVKSLVVEPYTLALRAYGFYSSAWWSTTISVGTPPQTIDAKVNFAAPETYVPNNQYHDELGGVESCCGSPACNDKVFCKATCYPRCCGKLTDPTHSDCIFGYDKRFSSTYTGNASAYCLQSNRLGRNLVYAANDTIHVLAQKLIVENFRFGTIYRPTDCVFRNASLRDPYPYAQLGLGKPTQQPVNWVFGHESILSRLSHQENMKMIFTLWVNASASGYTPSYSEVTLGALNTKKCGAPSYTPFEVVNSEIKVPLNGLYFGSFNLSLPEGYYYNVSMMMQPKTVYVGVGTFPLFLQIGSKMILDEIRKTIGTGDDARLDCSTKVPPIQLAMGGQVYGVPPERFVINDGHGDCFLNLAADTDDEGRWAFGLSFAQQFCIVVDYDNDRLGFAQNLVV